MPGWIGNLLLTVRSPLVLRLDTTTTLTRPKARSDFHQSSSRCATPSSGCLADGRRERRQTRTKPLIESLKIWLEAQFARVPGRSEIAKDIRYGLSHWEGLIRVLGRRPHRDQLQYRRAIHQANCDDRVILHPLRKCLETLRADFLELPDTGDLFERGRRRPARYRDRRP